MARSDELRRGRGAELEELPRGGGPRFGTLAATLQCLCAGVPRARTPSHWLDAFEPVGHLASSWWVYRLDADLFRAALEERQEPELAADFAIAALGEGDQALASELLSRAQADARAALLARLLTLERSSSGSSAESGLERASLWLALGREDIARSNLESTPASGRPQWLELWVEAVVRDGEQDRALEAIGTWDGGVTPRTLMLAGMGAIDIGKGARRSGAPRALPGRDARFGRVDRGPRSALRELRWQVVSTATFHLSIP